MSEVDADKLGDLLAMQFTTGILYRGEEVIGRIRGIMHALEPHEDDGPCVVCDNDLDDYALVPPGSDAELELLVAYMQAQAVEQFGSKLGGTVQDAAMEHAKKLRDEASSS